MYIIVLYIYIYMCAEKELKLSEKEREREREMRKTSWYIYVDRQINNDKQIDQNRLDQIRLIDRQIGKIERQLDR